MNDEQQLLASAYLDGALTDEERARAEADPEVMAAVDRLGQLRRALAALEPPDRARRDAAINAALGLFDSESQVTAPPPVPSLAARRWTRWLMPAAAAAVVVILAGGILATRDGDGDGGGDDAAGSATSDVAGAALDVEEDQSADTAPSATGDTRSAPDEGGAAATTNAVTEAAGTLAAAAATTGAPEATAEASVVVLTSPEELTEFASVALFATDYAPPADVARATCDEVEGQWLGPATYVDDGVETAVEIFLVAAADEVRAVHTATCTVIAIAPAPQR
jgi:hypothetical protein